MTKKNDKDAEYKERKYKATLLFDFLTQAYNYEHLSDKISDSVLDIYDICRDTLGHLSCDFGGELAEYLQKNEGDLGPDGVDYTDTDRLEARAKYGQSKAERKEGIKLADSLLNDGFTTPRYQDMTDDVVHKMQDYINYKFADEIKHQLQTQHRWHLGIVIGILLVTNLILALVPSVVAKFLAAPFVWTGATLAYNFTTSGMVGRIIIMVIADIIEIAVVCFWEKKSRQFAKKCFRRMRMKG